MRPRQRPDQRLVRPRLRRSPRIAAIGCDDDLAATVPLAPCAGRLISRGKRPKVALIAALRKLLGAIFAVMRKLLGAIFAVMRKLLGAIFAVMRDRKPFVPRAAAAA
jgi:hypothetical protein